MLLQSKHSSCVSAVQGMLVLDDLIYISAVEVLNRSMAEGRWVGPLIACPCAASAGAAEVALPCKRGCTVTHMYTRRHASLGGSGPTLSCSAHGQGRAAAADSSTVCAV